MVGFMLVDRRVVVPDKNHRLALDSSDSITLFITNRNTHRSIAPEETHR